MILLYLRECVCVCARTHARIRDNKTLFSSFLYYYKLSYGLSKKTSFHGPYENCVFNVGPSLIRPISNSILTKIFLLTPIIKFRPFLDSPFPMYAFYCHLEKNHRRLNTPSLRRRKTIDDPE